MRALTVLLCLLATIPGRSPLKAMEFVSLPAGSFIMGCSPEDTACRDNEKPPHRVQISKPFRIQKYEVTQAQWLDVMEVNPSDVEGNDLPVHNVSWDDVQLFLLKLNARGDGFRYRLPTEAEWEYAARADVTTAYSGSLDATAWYNKNSGHQPHPVGTKQANAWEIHDMSGNVWEWVADWFGPSYYAATPAADPQGPASGQQHAVRGGSFSDNAEFARVSNRFGVTTGFGNYDLGFRCVRDPTE